MSKYSILVNGKVLDYKYKKLQDDTLLDCDLTRATQAMPS